VAQDEHGNVYLAAGQIKVYSPEGVAIEEIDVPERPIDLVFGGPERHSLYILTHKSLYVVATRWAGL
jgi:sugar lactone lactonase YvrE